MKRFTFEVVLAGTLALVPCALAHAQTDDPTTGSYAAKPDAAVAPSMSPAPSYRREQATTPYGSEPMAAPGDRKPLPPEQDPTMPPKGSRAETGNLGGTTTSGNTSAPTYGTTPSGAIDDVHPYKPSTVANNSADVDLDYIAKVHQANQKEIEVAQMALDKAESSRVKSYARKLLNDHQAADKKLMAYVDRKNLDRSKVEAMSTGGTTPGSTDAHSRLQNLSGADFDREFVNVMLDEHDKAIDMVKSARDAATDRELRGFYGSIVPKLEQHRKMARDLADKHMKS